MKIKAPALSKSAEKELILILFIYRYKKSPSLAGFTGFRSFVPGLSISNWQMPLSKHPEKSGQHGDIVLIQYRNTIKMDSYRTCSHEIFLLQQKNIALSTP